MFVLDVLHNKTMTKHKGSQTMEAITKMNHQQQKPHQRHYVVSLSKTHLSLHSTGSTQGDPSKHD